MSERRADRPGTEEHEELPHDMATEVGTVLRDNAGVRHACLMTMATIR